MKYTLEIHVVNNGDCCYFLVLAISTREYCKIQITAHLNWGNQTNKFFLNLIDKVSAQLDKGNDG